MSLRLLLCLVVVGCSASNDRDAGVSDAGSFDCPAPVTINDVDELIALMPETYGGYAIGVDRFTTAPLVAGVDLEVPQDRIPTECVSSCEVVVVPHVSAIAVGPDISIPAGTIFRIRAYSETFFGGPVPTTRAYLSFLPGCDVPCPPNTLRCPVDGVCYHNGGLAPERDVSSGEQYCVDCLGLTYAECDCVIQWSPRETRPNGESCNVCRPETDFCESGTCRRGACEIDE